MRKARSGAWQAAWTYGAGSVCWAPSAETAGHPQIQERVPPRRALRAVPCHAAAAACHLGTPTILLQPGKSGASRGEPRELRAPRTPTSRGTRNAGMGGEGGRVPQGPARLPRMHSPEQAGERVAGRAQAAPGAPRAAAAAAPRRRAAAAPEARRQPLPRQQLLHGREVPGAGRLQQLLLLPHPQRRRPPPGLAPLPRRPNFPSPGNAHPQNWTGTPPPPPTRSPASPARPRRVTSGICVMRHHAPGPRPFGYLAGRGAEGRARAASVRRHASLGHAPSSPSWAGLGGLRGGTGVRARAGGSGRAWAASCVTTPPGHAPYPT